MYKVLIADDEAIIRVGLARFVESDPEFRVVATAEDGRAALALAREHRPDLALVDINMPFINGIALTEQLVAMLPDIVIVIISGYDDGTFQPEKTITRQEAASILKNAFNLTGNSGEKFPDDSAIAGWAKENVYAVKHSGLMKGDADTGNFRPTSTIIRAEAASILMNANRAGLIK